MMYQRPPSRGACLPGGHPRRRTLASRFPGRTRVSRGHDAPRGKPGASLIMARNFKELESRMRPESRARAETRSKEMMAEICLPKSVRRPE